MLHLLDKIAVQGFPRDRWIYNRFADACKEFDKDVAEIEEKLDVLIDLLVEKGYNPDELASFFMDVISWKVARVRSEQASKIKTAIYKTQQLHDEIIEKCDEAGLDGITPSSQHEMLEVARGVFKKAFEEGHTLIKHSGQMVGPDEEFDIRACFVMAEEGAVWEFNLI